MRGVHVVEDDADEVAAHRDDALLGAAALGNIGILFPDTDPRFAGANSAHLLAEVWSRVSSLGWRIANLDCVVIAQKPRLNPHVPAMQERIARILDIAPECVSVKPKTNEGMGFEGRLEGVSVQAAVLLTR